MPTQPERYKALRSAGGLRRPLSSLRKEKKVKVSEADRRSMIEYIFFECCSCKLIGDLIMPRF